MSDEQLQLNSKTSVVLCSGGPDSIYLLNFLLNQQKKIIVLHINYNKRKNSIDDQKIVEDFCKKNNIKIMIHNYKNNSKGNFQNLARTFRYNIASEIAKDVDGIVYTGHHFDDNIETIIFQRERKSVPSYFGIKKKTSWNDIEIIRPLLEIKKKEIIEYLTKNKIKYAVDISNFSDTYTRNKIRKRIKTMTKEAINNLIKQADNDNKELIKLNNIAKMKFEIIFKNNKINIEQFKIVKNNSTDLIIILMIRYLNKNNIKFSRSKVKNIISFISKTKKQKYFRLSDQYILKNNDKYYEIIFENAKA